MEVLPGFLADAIASTDPFSHGRTQQLKREFERGVVQLLHGQITPYSFEEHHRELIGSDDGVSDVSVKSHHARILTRGNEHMLL